MKSKIKFIYFDIGGVLVDWSNVFINVATQFHRDRKEFRCIFSENIEAITKGSITSEDLWEICIKELQIRNTKNFQFVESWVSDYKPILQMHDFVKALQKTYKIGLFSNIYSGMRELLFQQQLVPSIQYKQIILSYEVGMMKPEKNIYKLAQRKTGVSSDEILLVDDREDFLIPARELGWKTILFQTTNPLISVQNIKDLLLPDVFAP